jgi:hypothetical protein
VASHALQLGVRREPITVEMLIDRAEEMRTERVPRTRHRRRWSPRRWRQLAGEVRRAFREAAAEHPEAACAIFAVAACLGCMIGASS